MNRSDSPSGDVNINLPWSMEPSTQGYIHDSDIYSASGPLGHVLIAEVMDEREAKLIVKAVNLHDELVEALKELGSVFFELSGVDLPVSSGMALLTAVEKARAVLEKAK